MSLLMDALKKAEAAKRQGTDGTAMPGDPDDAKPAELSLQPIGGSQETGPAVLAGETHAPEKTENSPANLPKLPTHLGGLDAEFVAHHEQQKAALATPAHLNSASSLSLAPATTPAQVSVKTKTVSPGTESQASRDAARNVFEAKTKVPPAGNKKFAIAMGVLTIAVTLVAVGYFWLQLQPKTGLVAVGSAARPVVAATPAQPIVAPAPATPFAPANPAPPGQASATVAAALAPAPAPVPMQAEKKKRIETVAEDFGDGQVRLVRVSKSPLKINPALVNGFENFNRGDFAAAKTDYEAVLKSEPQNTEALHGLAAIAVREGRLSLADHFYERILIADPKDATAMSAMINLHRQNDPIAAESRLQAIIAEQPGSSGAQFALGNLYVSEKRWGDAQQAYFKAYSADPDNPDILYNLAVSLEHMTQAKLAYQYYSLALDAAKRRPAGFDLAVASARATALKP